MSIGFLGTDRRKARSKRVKERALFLQSKYPDLSQEEAFRIAWELERLAAEEKRGTQT